jgi:outer membrane immunogenic protein
MKRLLLGIAAVAVMASAPAAAADLPVKARPPVVAPVFSWTGFYIGGFAGWAWADRSVVTTDPCLVGIVCGATGSYNDVAPIRYDLDSSFIGGGTLGYNWQTGPAVFGIEAEVGYLHLDGSRQFVDAAGVPVEGTTGDTSAHTRIGDWYAVFAGRLGIAANQALFYAKGGAVVTRVENGVVDACITPGLCGGGTINTTGSETIWGWAAGGGLEYAFGAWSIKGEYLYLGIRQTLSHSGVVGPDDTAIDVSVSRDPGVHTAKLGLNYRWNWAGTP